MNIVALLTHSFLLTNLWGEEIKKALREEALASEWRVKESLQGWCWCSAHHPPAHLLTVLLWREPATKQAQDSVEKKQIITQSKSLSKSE